MKKIILCLFALLNLIGLGCSSRPTNPEVAKILPEMENDKYEDLIEKNTRGDRQYKGFYNTFQVEVTALTSEVTAAILQRRAHYQQWDAAKARAEREKAMQEMSSQAQFFLSFYSPDRHSIDLDRGNSIWKAYLEFEGQRFEGTIKKVKDKLLELQAIYPHHTRFNTAYMVSFNVPMSSIENGKAVFILTSSLGSTNLEFGRKE